MFWIDKKTRWYIENSITLKQNEPHMNRIWKKLVLPFIETYILGHFGAKRIRFVDDGDGSILVVRKKWSFICPFSM